jgi:hypothetical protein
VPWFTPSRVTVADDDPGYVGPSSWIPVPVNQMLPELARRAISAYSDPGDLVVDPMCGIGTTLVEAIHLGRNALGIELERRWASLATANLALAREQGATGNAGVVEGDASELPRLLTRNGRQLPRSSGRNAKTSESKVARLGAGSVDLILTSPPYACEIQMIDKPAWLAGVWGALIRLCPRISASGLKLRHSAARLPSELRDVAVLSLYIGAIPRRSAMARSELAVGALTPLCSARAGLSVRESIR